MLNESTDTPAGAPDYQPFAPPATKAQVRVPRRVSRAFLLGFCLSFGLLLVFTKHYFFSGFGLLRCPRYLGYRLEFEQLINRTEALSSTSGYEFQLFSMLFQDCLISGGVGAGFWLIARAWHKKAEQRKQRVG